MPIIIIIIMSQTLLVNNCIKRPGDAILILGMIIEQIDEASVWSECKTRMIYYLSFSLISRLGGIRDEQ